MLLGAQRFEEHIGVPAEHFEGAFEIRYSPSPPNRGNERAVALEKEGKLSVKMNTSAPSVARKEYIW